MNSSNNGNAYSSSPQLIYGAHYVELIDEEVKYENNKGKFLLSYITPSSSEGYSRTTPKNNTGAVISDGNLGLERVTTSSYKELVIPKHLFSIKEIKTTISPNTRSGEYGLIGCNPKATNEIVYEPFKKGQKFIVVNLGGDINSPCIIGVI